GPEPTMMMLRVSVTIASSLRVCGPACGPPSVTDATALLFRRPNAAATQLARGFLGARGLAGAEGVGGVLVGLVGNPAVGHPRRDDGLVGHPPHDDEHAG